MSSTTTQRLAPDLWRLAAGLAGVAAVTVVYRQWVPTPNATTVSLTLLVVVLVVAATSRLWTAVVTSVIALLAFNFFFLPPVGTLTIADPQNWVALFAFLAVSLVASNLSAIARARAQEAVDRRDELARLFDLSRDVLVITESREAMAVLARAIARRFDLDFVAIALPRQGEWDLTAAGVRTLTVDSVGADDGVCRGTGDTRIRCLRAHVRRPSHHGGRGHDHSTGASAGRDQADWAACGSGKTD